MIVNVPDKPFKYKEAEILQEVASYVAKTYEGHYVGEEDDVQSIDHIAAAGHAIGFCVGDIIKYAGRYGKKAGEERKDIMKIIHYGMFLLYFHDKIQAKKNSQKPINMGGIQLLNEAQNMQSQIDTLSKVTR